MKEGIKQEVCGHIQPLILNNSTIPGSVQTLIDWNAIIESHRPVNSTNYTFKGQLEYIQLDYYISSLNIILETEFPKVNELRDSNLKKQTTYAEFKRKFNPEKKYAIELMLHTKWEDNDWGMAKASEYLYNLRQYGYINLFDPYLLRDSEVLYSDARYKIGVSTNGLFKDFDRAEINGGYSGIISYFEKEVAETLSENSGAVEVGSTPVKILNARNNRKILFVSNGGNSRLFFRFTNYSSSVNLNCPFLEPGENLSIEFENYHWSGGNNHQWMAAATKYYLPLSLYAIREDGIGNVTYQEFY